MRELEGIEYEALWVETIGDRDLKSSLSPMEKTDFFTREIDEKVLSGKCRVGIHSAKDLPDPLPKGLKMVALTKGVDSSDSLVFREGEFLETLKSGATIGSSSKRRSQIVRGLRPDLLCTEVRGPVDARLGKLDRGEIDGLVVAEAALIRLGLEGRNRIPLPGEVAPLQGKLAVLAREDDKEMEKLFKPLDTRKKRKVLYLGISPKYVKEEVVHCPLIHVVARDFSRFDIQNAFADIPEYTHLIFTSKNGVEIFFRCLEHHGYGPLDLGGKQIFAVGKVTAHGLEKRGVKVSQIAPQETQEGVIHLLAMEDLNGAYILLPQSSRSRPALTYALMGWGVRHQKIYLYDTKIHIPAIKPKLDDFDEIIFTSPSTVDAFNQIFKSVPKGIKMTPIGPITEKALKLKLKF